MSLMGLPNTIKSLPLHWKKIKASPFVFVWGLFYGVLTSLRVSQVAIVVKNPSANAGDQELQVPSLGWEDALEEGMTTYSSILAWRIPMDRPGRLQSRGSRRVRHD